MILDIPDRVWGGWSMACSKANPAGVAGGMRCFEAYDWRRTDLRRGPLRHLGNDAANPPGYGDGASGKSDVCRSRETGFS
jgi:hypothetical protein